MMMMQVLDSRTGEVIAADVDWRKVACELTEVARVQEDWRLVNALLADPAMIVLHLNTIYDPDSGEETYRILRSEGTRLVGSCDRCGEVDTVTTSRGDNVCDHCAAVPA